MEIATTGAGRVAKALARKALAAGHYISFGKSGEPIHLQPLVAKIGQKARSTTREEAVADFFEHLIYAPVTLGRRTFVRSSRGGTIKG